MPWNWTSPVILANPLSANEQTRPFGTGIHSYTQMAKDVPVHVYRAGDIRAIT
jgi:hypothetical protein